MIQIKPMLLPQVKQCQKYLSWEENVMPKKIEKHEECFLRDVGFFLLLAHSRAAYLPKWPQLTPQDAELSCQAPPEFLAPRIVAIVKLL